MPSFFGNAAFPLRAWRGIAKPRRWLPSREARFYFQWGSKWVGFHFQPHRGMYPDAVYRVQGYDLVMITEGVSLRSKAMKKVSIGLEPGKSLPPLSSESVVLKKFPLLRFFLTGTSYEDGSPRAPGRIWVDNDGVGFRVTLFEPSAFARVALRANTIDDVFACCEVFLSADNPPWEADQYAREKAAQKKRK